MRYSFITETPDTDFGVARGDFSAGEGEIRLVLSDQGRFHANTVAILAALPPAPTHWLCGIVVYQQPRTVFISDLRDKRFQMVGSLPVSVECNSEKWTVFSHDLDELGYGDDEHEAFDDFRASLIESYLLLKREQKNLGPLQQRHWEFLSRLIREV